MLKAVVSWWYRIIEVINDNEKNTFYCNVIPKNMKIMSCILAHKNVSIYAKNIKYITKTIYNENLRNKIRRNHTATHLLNQKLKKMFKSEQKGS